MHVLNCIFTNIQIVKVLAISYGATYSLSTAVCPDYESYVDRHVLTNQLGIFKKS